MGNGVEHSVEYRLRFRGAGEQLRDVVQRVDPEGHRVEGVGHPADLVIAFHVDGTDICPRGSLQGGGLELAQRGDEPVRQYPRDGEPSEATHDQHEHERAHDAQRAECCGERGLGDGHTPREAGRRDRLGAAQKRPAFAACDRHVAAEQRVSPPLQRAQIDGRPDGGNEARRCALGKNEHRLVRIDACQCEDLLCEVLTQAYERDADSAVRQRDRSSKPHSRSPVLGVGSGLDVRQTLAESAVHQGIGAPRERRARGRDRERPAIHVEHQRHIGPSPAGRKRRVQRGGRRGLGRRGGRGSLPDSVDDRESTVQDLAYRLKPAALLGGDQCR